MLKKLHRFLGLSILTGFTALGCVAHEMQPGTDLRFEGAVSSNLSAVTPSDWMAAVYDTTSLSAMSIPGTHDSGARFEPWPGTAKCQTLTIAEQLTIGVRFLDIRGRHIDNAFAIHHGSIYQNLNFDDVLNATIGFLNAHPTETVIMSLKEEYNPTNNTRSFEQTFDAYVAKNPSKWVLGSEVPYLGSVRGKIVLFRRFGASQPKGIDASSWPDNTTFTSGNLRVQDSYVVNNTATKWGQVTALLDEAAAANNQLLYVNFSSGYKPGIFSIPDINAVANYNNPRLQTYFAAHAHGRFGIIPMDFADATRVALIYKTN